MTDSESSRGRPSIAERAERRERMDAGGRDRYSTLVRTLQAGRDVPLGRVRETRFEWNPIFWTLVKLALVLVAAYFITLFAYNWWRDQRVDTWTGPDAAVQSGQRLAGCDAANRQHDDLFPTWVRFQGVVYVLTDRRRPVIGNSEPGRTQFVETGYSQERIRILLPAAPVAGQPPDDLLLVVPPAFAGRIFDADPSCA